MKKLYLIILLSALFVSFGYGQAFVWTDPVPLTDSVSNNSNINMTDIFDYSNDSVNVVWEKSVDTASTAIYCRNLLTMSEPFAILSQQNVHFRHPMIFNWVNGDTSFIVLYETNMNGNWDIYYSKVLKDGSTAPPVAVCNSSADEKNYQYHSGPGIVWEQNGNIMFENFSIFGSATPLTIVTLDQGNCHNPVLSSSLCEWEKVIGADTVIMYSGYNFSDSSWSAPAQLIGGVNKNLSCGTGDGPFLVWQAKENMVWRLKAEDVHSQLPYFFNDFPGSNNIDPAFIDVLIVTKHGLPFFPSFCSFASDVTGTYEIYVNHNLFDSTYINISNYASLNHHPQFFSSWVYAYGYQTVFLCWESWRNNHWQIWMSHIDIPEGMNEQTSSGSASLQNYPNPFADATTIKYEIGHESYASITIFNTMGMKVRTLKEGTEQPGKHSLTWDGKDANGIRMTPGIYICSLEINNKRIQRKITIL